MRHLAWFGLMALSAVSGCDHPGPDLPGDLDPDAPGDMTLDLAGDGGASEVLVMQVRGPFYAIDHPHSNEDYDALADVYDEVGFDLNEVIGASVTLNGINLPSYRQNGFTTRGAQGVQIAPGLAIDLVATHGTAHAELRFTCPDDVLLTAPVDGTAVAPGDDLLISWTGTLNTGNAVDPAVLSIEPYDSVLNRGSPDPTVGRVRVLPAAGSSTATLSIPQPVAGFDGYAVTLRTPGDAAFSPPEVGGEPWCTLWRRVHLKLK